MSAGEQGPVVPVERAAHPIDPGVRIGHVHLRTADIDRIKAFYVGVLGFDVIAEARGVPGWGTTGDILFVSAGGYHHHLGFNTWKSAGGGPQPDGVTGLHHVALNYPSRGALGDVVRRLREADWPLRQVSDHGTHLAIYITDPDGNDLELAWDRPPEEWPRDDAGHGALVMDAEVDLEALVAEGAAPVNGLIAVTGSTGELGGRVAARLAARGVAQRLIVRDAARAPALDGAEIALAPGYHDGPAMTEALRGVKTLFLVSGREAPDRVAQHFGAVDAALAAGVEHIVYTSFIAAAPDTTFTLGRHHHATEERIRATGMAHTFLRNSMYLDFVPFFASADGVIAGPAGDGRTAWVARDDVADVAAAVLTEGGHEGHSYELTGPAAHTLTYAAAELTRATGRPVIYKDETIEEAYASRAPSGAPDYEIEGWVTSYVAVAKGDLDVVSDTVPSITGHPALGLREFLERNPGTYAHIV